MEVNDFQWDMNYIKLINNYILKSWFACSMPSAATLEVLSIKPVLG